MTSCLQIEPFNLSIEEIADLDEFQIIALIGTVDLRNEESRKRMAGNTHGETMDPNASDDELKPMFWAMGRLMNQTEEQIQLRWDNRHNPAVLKVATNTAETPPGFAAKIKKRREPEEPARPKTPLKKRSQFMKDE